MREDPRQFRQLRAEAPVARAPAQPRHPRRHGLAGALVPRGRIARLALAFGLGVIALGSLAALALYVLIATGTITADIATPYIERALEERIGGGHKVIIRETSVETQNSGATVVVVHDIKVEGSDGQMVASAPSAEVELEGSLLSLTPRARRIDLVGAEMTVRIGAAGDLAVAAGKGAKPLSPLGSRKSGQGANALTAPAPGAAPPPAGAPPAGQSAAPVAGDPAATGNPAAATAPGAPAPATDPLLLPGLAQWMNELAQAGLDGGGLSDVGLKDGTLVVENESSGKRIVFQHIGIRLARPAAGQAVFTFTSQGPNGIATVVAKIMPGGGGDHAVEVTAQDISTRDLVQAFSQDHRRFYMDTPLQAALSARIAADGAVSGADMEVNLGAGAMGNGEEKEERFIIDRAQIKARLDAARRTFVLDPVFVAKNENRVGLKGEVEVPRLTSEPWPFRFWQDGIRLAGPEMSDPPLAIDQVNISGAFVPADKRLRVSTGELVSSQGSLSFTADVDFSPEVPVLTLNGAGSAMPVATIKRFWPVTIAPPARHFVLDNLTVGKVNGATIAVRLPVNLIGQKQVPLPDDGLNFTISGQDVTFRPVAGLPPIVDADMTVVVTGRTVRIAMPQGTVLTPQNRRLKVSDGVMFIADHFPREPTAQIKVAFDGPADAGIEVLGMEPLKGPAGAAFDPSTTRGRLSALLQLNVTFRKVPLPEDLDYSLEATLTDFGVDKVFKAQRLEGANVKAFAAPSGITLRGEGKLGGAPVAFEYEKKKDVADATIRVNATLDEAARQRLGFSVPGISGSLSVKLVGTTNNKDTKATLEVDLTNSRIAELIPGLSKPPGKPLKARFVVNDRGNTVRLEDLVLEGSGIRLRGALELSDNGDLLSATFPVFQINDGDKASLKAESSGGVLKIRITGEVMDARNILKSLADSAPLKRGQKPPPDVDVDAKIGALTGNNGEVLRQFDFQVSRRGVVVTNFTLTAKAGRNGTVAGEMRAFQGKQRALHISTSDAGAMLRFLDIYPKIQGGEAWLVLDPPRSDAATQEGVLHLRDFVIRGEPGLERLSAAARDPSGKTEGGAAAFDKAQASFARSSGKISFRDGAIWGPAVGATFDGTLDFAADHMAMRGTYVPAYGLNNLFSKLPVIGMFLGGGPNEGLLGVTFEVVGPISTGPTLRINPMSAVAPGFLRKIFEFRGANEGRPLR